MSDLKNTTSLVSAVLKPWSNTETMQHQITQWFKLHSDQAQATDGLFVELNQLSAYGLTFIRYRVYTRFILLDSKMQRILNPAKSQRDIGKCYLFQHRVCHYKVNFSKSFYPNLNW